MGVWDFINSSMDQTKQNAPNLSSVKNACWSSYNYTCYGVKKIDNTVRVNGIQRFYSSYWPDAEARAKIGLFAKIFTANTADYAMHEGIKLLPGGKTFSKIVSQTMRDVKSESNKKQQMKAVQTKVGPGEDSIDCRNLIDQPQDAKSSSQNTHGFEKPEDVIRNFMATEFVGNRILADLMVTEISRDEARKDKIMLKCQNEKCGAMKWLEDAIGMESSSSSTTAEANNSSEGCFQCGQNDHWVRSCPWKDTPCPFGCQGTRKLWTSRQKKSYGQKFLKCLNCGSFEWLSNAIAKSKKLNLRIKVEVSNDGLCHGFETKLK